MAMAMATNAHHLSPPPLLFTPRFPSASSHVTAMATKQSANGTVQNSEYAKEKIRQMFQKVELSVSAYDTAWVAMAPCPTSPSKPCFPGSVDWILENQLRDGSWGLAERDSSLVKDALTSTLSCVLALKTWSVGEQQIRKGLDYIVSNFASTTNNESLISPIGFNVIFPSLIEKAIDMNINLHLPPTQIDAMLRKKDSELKRIRGKNTKFGNLYHAYISEALGKSQDWGMVMTYQHENGSLFNSPSTTAAAFTELQDSCCHNYLRSALQKFGNAVPTLYPADAYFRLYMVDILEKLGINRHFKENISQVMNETFRQWKEGHEDIFSDLNTCILAFRLLRQHGYDVSSELLADKNRSLDQFGGSLEDIRYALELFKASQIKLYSHEVYLDENVSDSRRFLERQISENVTQQADDLSKSIRQEIADALKIPYHATVERLEHRKNIENFNWDGTRVLKSSLRYVNFSNKDLLQLAKDDFSNCQSVQNEEIKRLQRWVVESKLDTLTFSRQKLGYCYFSAAATLIYPEQTDARVSWAKNGVLTTIVDDFFDLCSTEEEQMNLIQLLEEWDAKTSTKACSENVDIIFSALSGTISEIGEKARLWQDHDVTKHVVEIWLSLMKAMRLEAEWSRNKALPSMEEYMANGYTSFALGPIVLPALYLIGPKLPEKVIRGAEYHRLFELMSTFGRLFNDIQGYQREEEDGKLNAVSLRVLHGKGSDSKEDAIRELKKVMNDSRKELLRMVLRTDENEGVPRECRDAFWKMSKSIHFFYKKDDGFSSNELKNVVKSILYDPINAS
ncbi:hypothetical protein RND81_11G160900 [Saponaria officinalis]|uniref:Ent-kaurene synthase n=1 Tax=Saponaria officinalis TaxID=3572 RepID=A0AAW1HPD8_SAPOF